MLIFNIVQMFRIVLQASRSSIWNKDLLLHVNPCIDIRKGYSTYSPFMRMYIQNCNYLPSWDLMRLTRISNSKGSISFCFRFCSKADSFISCSVKNASIMSSKNVRFITKSTGLAGKAPDLGSTGRAVKSSAFSRS